MKSLTIKKHDVVVVISGKSRGSRGKVLRVILQTNRVLVEGVALHKRHQRPRRTGQKGEIINVPSSIHRSNVMLWCAHCSRGVCTKTGREGDQKTRMCKRCSNIV